MRRNHHDRDTVLVGAVSAAIASGITYFLYGTEGGEKTRKDIRRVASHTRDRALEIKDDVTSKGADLLSTAKKSYEDVTDLFKENASVLKEINKEDLEWITKRFKERMSDVWEETQADIEDVIDDAKRG